MRAILVVILIAMPSIMLPVANADAAQIVALVALFGGALTLVEYSSNYPCLIEFRHAPPFNRIRFGSLFVTILLLTIMSRGLYQPSQITYVVEAIGSIIGHVIDFPYSPVRLVVLMLPPGTSVEHITMVRSAAGLSYLVSIMTLIVFITILRLQGWPRRRSSFNVWVNLPTFDPTAGADVVERLERDARFNIALGFLLPFLTPAVIKAASSLFGSVSLENPQTLIWTMAAWAFLPASLFMRGIAMNFIANMIYEMRRQNLRDTEDAYQPA